MRTYYVYFLAKHRHGLFNVGMTNDLVRRVHEHREGNADGFTKRYGIEQLVYFEQHASAASAIQREKITKGWSRNWRIHQIEKANPRPPSSLPGLTRQSMLNPDERLTMRLGSIGYPEQVRA